MELDVDTYVFDKVVIGELRMSKMTAVFLGGLLFVMLCCVSCRKTGQHLNSATEVSDQSPKDDTQIIVQNSLSQEQISKAILARTGDVRRCYETLALAENPDLEGRVATKFIISEDGSVTMIAIAETTLNHKPTENCVATVVKSIVFPTFIGGGIVVVTFPFKFSLKETALNSHPVSTQNSSDEPEPSE